MKTSLIISLLGAVLLFSGCGGGGGGGAIGAAPSGTIFITDSLDDHTHVWVTITRVVLHGGGAAVTVFEPAGGLTVDLRTLRDSAGARFSFLATTPEGTFDDITFTLDKDVILFEVGNQTGLHRQFAGRSRQFRILRLRDDIEALSGIAKLRAMNIHLSIDVPGVRYGKHHAFTFRIHVGGAQRLLINPCEDLFHIWARHHQVSSS